MTLYDRLHRALTDNPPLDVEDERHFGTPDGGHRAAAVLVPITDRPEPGVILTQRPQWLRSHPGQVAFPGGKIDPHDADEIAAALREAEEELAMDPRQVRVVGTADVYHSGSGFRITPVLAVIPPDLPLDPNPDEVEAWFEVPLAHLFDAANYERQEAIFMGQRRGYFDMRWEGRRIWGVTAAIIMNLAARLRL